MRDSKAEITLSKGEDICLTTPNDFCQACGSDFVERETCHVRCNQCGYVSEGCGD